VLRDRRSKTETVAPSPPSQRLEAKTCLVTGANSGLGYAIARDLAVRGAHLILANRSAAPETANTLIRETGNSAIETLQVDLADLNSVTQLIEKTAKITDRVDRLILNAGLMAATAKASPQDYEEMFAVHYLANYLLITGLADKGLLDKSDTGSPARVIAISSEAHRSALPIEPESFGQLNPHTFGTALKQYGHTKLAMSLMISGLSERYIDPDGLPTISFFQSSPGPVNTNIARSAPLLIRPLAKLLLPLLFQSPAQACAPAVYLACSPELETKTDLYMHLMRFKQPSEAARNASHKRHVLGFAQAACQAKLS